MSGQSCPFSVQLLPQQQGQQAKNSSPKPGQPTDSLVSNLPASYRDKFNHVASPACQVDDWLKKELDLRRLSRIQELLWFAGLPLPPRPLHRQLLLNRNILITEQMDMHLVWAEGRIHVKPLPRFLLDPLFWSKHLSCLTDCGCANTSGSLASKCQRRELWETAVGFLFSYTALISYESDFHIAVEHHLLPPNVEWLDWRTLVYELNPTEIHQHINPRFYHGELRLSRLNKIYSMWKTPGQGYLPRWDRYDAFFRDNFSWLAATTVYIALVLTAMQVGQGTDLLANSDAFASAAYGFTVFSILGPLICAVSIFALFALMYAYNWVKSRRFYINELQRISELSSPQRP